MRENGAKDRAKMPFAPNNQKPIYKAIRNKVLAESNQTHAPIGVLSSTPSPKPPQPQLAEKVNLHPKLPYINLTVGLPENKGPLYDQLGIKTKILIDTGAGKTTMHKDFYLKLMSFFNGNHNSLTVIPDYGIKTIVGSTQLISGMTKFRLWISQTPPIYRDGTAMVIDNLAEDFIIGYDILGSNWTRKLTSQSLVMTNPYDGSDVIIPIKNKIMDLIPCWFLKTTNVSSHDTKIISTKLVKPLPKGTQFCIKNHKDSRTKCFTHSL